MSLPALKPETQLHHTPQLVLSCSPAVAQAATQLVAIKDELDALGRSAAGSAIVRCLFPHRNDYGSMGPHFFAEEVLPFFRHTQAKANTTLVRRKALVPAAHVIGLSWRWWPDDRDEDAQQGVFTAAEAAFNGSGPERRQAECADYYHVAPLGVVLAHEGKNRVALYKARGVPLIPALVTDEDYPARDRLRLFDLKSVHLAVLDGRLVERIVALPLIRQLMEAYGVEIESTWPAEFPPLSDVLAEFSSPYRDSNSELDLVTLALDVKARNTEVEASLLDVDHIKLPSWKRWFSAFVCLIALVVAFALTSVRWPEAAWPIATIAGALGMLLVTPVLPLLRCQVRHLKERQRFDHFVTARARVARKASAMR